MVLVFDQPAEWIGPGRGRRGGRRSGLEFRRGRGRWRWHGCWRRGLFLPQQLMRESAQSRPGFQWRLLPSVHCVAERADREQAEQEQNRPATWAVGFLFPATPRGRGRERWRGSGRGRNVKGLAAGRTRQRMTGPPVIQLDVLMAMGAGCFHPDEGPRSALAAWTRANRYFTSTTELPELSFSLVPGSFSQRLPSTTNL